MTTALQERIARALYVVWWTDHMQDPSASYDHPLNEDAREACESAADALLPIVEAEVRAAKAEAWREYAAALEAVPDYAPTEYDKGRVDQRHATVEELNVRATEYETGDQT